MRESVHVYTSPISSGSSHCRQLLVVRTEDNHCIIGDGSRKHANFNQFMLCTDDGLIIWMKSHSRRLKYEGTCINDFILSRTTVIWFFKGISS